MFNFYFSSPNELRINTIGAMFRFSGPQHHTFRKCFGKNIENLFPCCSIKHRRLAKSHVPSLSHACTRMMKREEARTENVFALIMMIKYFSVLNILVANWFCINYNQCGWLSLWSQHKSLETPRHSPSRSYQSKAVPSPSTARGVEVFSQSHRQQQTSLHQHFYICTSDWKSATRILLILQRAKSDKKRRRHEKIYWNHHLARTHMTKTRPSAR